MRPMPSDLQHRLEEASRKPNTEKGDLARFFSQDHLQHIFARLMGVRKGDSMQEADIDDDRETHPLWTRGLDLIKQRSELGDVPSAPAGLSNTVLEAIREFTTALSNMWSGPLYKKCLRYLCRIALRLWLAPSKDVKVKKWSANALKRKEERRHRRQERPETRKHWKAHTKQLFDDLGHVLLKKPLQWEEKVVAICKELGEMEEPETLSQRTLSIEQRMLQGAQDSTTVVESDAENSWASHKDLMTVDEDVSGIHSLLVLYGRRRRCSGSFVKQLLTCFLSHRARVVRCPPSGAGVCPDHADRIALHQRRRRRRVGEEMRLQERPLFRGRMQDSGLPRQHSSTVLPEKVRKRGWFFHGSGSACDQLCGFGQNSQHIPGRNRISSILPASVTDGVPSVNALPESGRSRDL